MARSNKAGQSDRTKNGARLEADVRLLLTQWLESSPELDKAFKVAAKKECRIPIRYPGAIVDFVWLPDFMIVHEPSGAVVVIGGAKASLRERYPVDGLPWDYARRIYPGGVLYFQATVREIKKHTSEKIRQTMQAKRDVYGDLLPLLFSTKDPDSEIKAGEVITNHLFSFLRSTHKDLSKFPRSCYQEQCTKSISHGKSKPDEEQSSLLFK